jgi:hypothetical protein
VSPEFLPHFVSLMIGVFLGAAATHRLLNRKWGSALKLGLPSILLISLAVVGGRYAASRDDWRLPESMRPHPLRPARDTAPAATRVEGGETMNLVLGGAVLRAMKSEQYDFSTNGETFLTLFVQDNGLLVSCDVAATQPFEWSIVSTPRTRARALHLGARISQNSVTQRASEVRPERPDDHTILVRENDVEILRVHYPEPRTIEVTGQFYIENLGGSGLVTLQKGIHWPGNLIPPGPVDLTVHGEGRIEFEPSGSIRVIPR